MIPITNKNVLLWRMNLRNHGSVRKPRSNEKTQIPDILNASIDAPAGSVEYKRALKRQRIENEIPACRGIQLSSKIIT